MKKKYKIAIILILLVVSFALSLPTILQQLHRQFFWMPAPGYLSFAWMQEIEITVKDESIIVTDRDNALNIFKSLSADYNRFRTRRFPSDMTISCREWPPWPYLGEVGASVDEILNTGFDYRFEIILRGCRGRMLTLIPVNVGTDALKFRGTVLFAIETEQIILVRAFRDFYYWAYRNGLPVELPYPMSEVPIQIIQP